MTGPLLSTADAAALLGISPRSFRQHVAPTCPRVRIGALVRYRLADLEAWADARADEPRRGRGLRPVRRVAS